MPDTARKFKGTSCRGPVLWAFSMLLIALGTAVSWGGSLWRDGYTDERGMFADKRARTVGDLVTVIVDEQIGSFNTLSLTTARANKSDSQGLAANLVNQFIQVMPNKIFNSNKFPGATGGIDTPIVSGTGSNAFTGGGTITNNQSINARATVQVVDVLPNGNLVIEGLREVGFSKERQFASLHGIIRTYDITVENTILSSRVADAQVKIISEGTLTEAQKKGWLSRLNDKISPY